MAVEIGIGDLDVYDNSQLVINQFLEDYEIKKKDLIPYQTQALQVLDKLDTFKLQYNSTSLGVPTRWLTRSQI